MKSQQSLSEAAKSEKENSLPLPDRCVTEGIPSAPEADSQSLKKSKPEDESSRLSSTNPESPLPEFVHQYLRDYIEFADQKAGFVFAAVSAILAYLVSKDALLPLKAWFSASTVPRGSDYLSLAAILFLLLSAIFAIRVIAPRLSGSRPQRKGFIFWKDICAFSNAEAYSRHLVKLTVAEASSQVREHCHVLAQICDHKYSRLNWAIWLGGIGFIATVLWFLFSK